MRLNSTPTPARRKTRLGHNHRSSRARRVACDTKAAACKSLCSAELTVKHRAHKNYERGNNEGGDRPTSADLLVIQNAPKAIEREATLRQREADRLAKVNGCVHGVEIAHAPERTRQKTW